MIERSSGVQIGEIDAGLPVVETRLLDAAAMNGAYEVMILVHDLERPNLLAPLAYDQGFVFGVQRMLVLARSWLMKFVFCDAAIQQ